MTTVTCSACSSAAILAEMATALTVTEKGKAFINSPAYGEIVRGTIAQCVEEKLSYQLTYMNVVCKTAYYLSGQAPPMAILPDSTHASVFKPEEVYPFALQNRETIDKALEPYMKDLDAAPLVDEATFKKELDQRFIPEKQLNLQKAKIKNSVKKNVAVMTLDGGSLVVSFIDNTGYGEHVEFAAPKIKGWFEREPFLLVHSLHNWCNGSLPCPDCGLINDKACRAEDQRVIVKRDTGYFVAHVIDGKLIEPLPAK